MTTSVNDFVDLIRRLSLEGKYEEAALKLIDNAQVFTRNIQHADVIMGAFTLPQYSLGALATLYSVSKSPTIPDFDRFITQFENFLHTCNAEQVKFLPYYVCEICHLITERLRRDHRARVGIPILYRAIAVLRRHEGHLLSINADLYQLCLLAQWFEPALHYLNTDINEIPKENGKMDVKQVLLAYYYGGMIYACVENFDRATDLFENCFTVPAHTTSAIALEAYKKYVLVKLISAPSSYSTQLPPFVSRSVQQSIKQLCGAYTELISLFNQGTLAQFDAFLTTHQGQYAQDRNIGLIKQTRQAFIYNSIQQLTKTFLTVSLKDLAQRVELTSANEAEEYLLDMIGNGKIFASINKKDGMVIFHGCPEKFDANGMLAQLQNETEKRMMAEKQLNDMEKQLSLSKNFLQRSMNAHERGGLSKMLF